MQTFNTVHLRLLSSRSAEEVFPDVTDAKELHKEVRRLISVLHPDAMPSNQVDADSASKLLAVWEARAKEKLEKGTWRDGKLHVAATFRTRKGVYELYYPLRNDAVVNVYAASLAGNPIEVRTARWPRHQEALASEGHILNGLQGPGLPVLVESFRIGNTERTAVATSPIPSELVPLFDLLRDHPEGLKPSHAIRYVDSLLEVLARAALHGVVHGSINPGTCWVRPRTAFSFISDWHYAVRRGGVITLVNDTYAEFCPWEVTDFKPTDAGTDLASVMKLLQWLVGVQDTPRQLQVLFAEHLREGRARPNDINQARLRLRQILKEITP